MQVDSDKRTSQMHTFRHLLLHWIEWDYLHRKQKFILLLSWIRPVDPWAQWIWFVSYGFVIYTSTPVHTWTRTLTMLKKCIKCYTYRKIHGVPHAFLSSLHCWKKAWFRGHMSYFVCLSHYIFCCGEAETEDAPPSPLSRHTFISLVSRLISSWFWDPSLYLSTPPRLLEQIKASGIWAGGLKLPLERLELPLTRCSLSPESCHVVRGFKRQHGIPTRWHSDTVFTFPWFSLFSSSAYSCGSR